jgi:hypothetical protein
MQQVTTTKWTKETNINLRAEGDSFEFRVAYTFAAFNKWFHRIDKRLDLSICRL